MYVRGLNVHTCQCVGFQMGQINGILLKEVSAVWSCP